MSKKTKEHSDTLPATVRQFLIGIGEDPDRDGLLDTPARVSEAWREFTSGYDQDAAAVIGEAVFNDAHEGIVLVKDIDFYSMCEHHLVPFFGKAHVAYVPDGRIVGLSKAARLVEIFARRLQVQERMTQQIADSLQEHLKPRGVAVMIQAQHLCMMMRGVEAHGSSAITTSMSGVFKSDAGLSAEFHQLLGHADSATAAD